MQLLYLGVHAVEHVIGDVDDETRALCQNFEIGAGHDRGDLDDGAPLRIQPGHLQIDPNQVRVAGHGAR